MDQNNIIECGGFYFIHNFDSGNLGHVERVPTELIDPLVPDIRLGLSSSLFIKTLSPSINSKGLVTETPDYEFNMWTRPDCAGTEFENGNRTWFYFGVQPSETNILVRLNLINLNKQGKMYNQGMAPVTRTLPGKPQWERIRDRPVHSTDDNTFTLSFKYRTADTLKATTFFAFTYPFSFAELQIALNSIDFRLLPLPPPQTPDDIYYYRECLIYSLEGRRVDLLTITSFHGITHEREDRLKNLFPDNQDRPFKFHNKKVIFISARVHPGETPSSFVFNGFLNLLLTKNDPIAIQLRKYYVFKMIPFLNPDGVARGHYRTDTRGVNLNRVYLNPSLEHHPTVFASRALIRYYHFGSEREDSFEDVKSYTSHSIQNISESAELLETKKKKADKRDRPLKGVGNNKSTTTLKQPSSSEHQGRPTSRKMSQNDQSRAVDGQQSITALKSSGNETARGRRGTGGEAALLADQVYDMKLQERPCQTSDSSSKMSSANIAEISLLNEQTLRSCLGSDVHLSTSEELIFQGSNPLRPLRDTLKNSISLLMESNSSIEKCPTGTGVKMGWCSECRRAIFKLEDSMPGITSLVPGYNPSMLNEPEPDKNEVYFCTNCFKRYGLSDGHEEIIHNAVEAASTASVALSSGGTGDAGPEHDHDTPRASPSPPPKEGKSKPPSRLTPAAKKKVPAPPAPPSTRLMPPKEPDSGLYLYIDLHGHASKKGIFMYGNHFNDVESCVECMLLPRIMSLNNLHFHFSSCNFTERNMYLKDRRDGMSREGSGRVAVLKATGLVRSYTLECNYNTGRLVNVLPPPVKAAAPAAPPAPPAPPKYTPHIFEEVGRSLGASILDLTGLHPNSRLPCSDHRNLSAVREWLRAHTRTMRPQLTMSRLRPKTTSPPRAPLYTRPKPKAVEERKENTYVGAKTDSERRRSPALTPPARPSLDTPKFKPEPTRARYLSDNEPKPKTLAAKRRSVLAVRKPNSGKAGGVVKAKLSRRSADDAEPRAAVSAKLSKRSFSRSTRGSAARASRCRAMASSSSDELGGSWEERVPEPLSGKRRPFPNPEPSRLKKIRLKTGL